MCGTCGCNDATVRVTDPRTGKQTVMQDRLPTAAHHHDDSHDHAHGGHHHHSDGDGRAHVHAHAHGTAVSLEQAILAKNDRLAADNRRWLVERRILALNLVSAPGAGKTTLLERTITDMGADMPIAVLEGDQATLNDAERILAAGAPVVQINTGAGCHLEADMVRRGLDRLDPAPGSVLMIENVGNLVCPALFDLGEQAKVVVLAVTEGADKPLKYPTVFEAADLLVIAKTDLLPHVDFDVDACLDGVRQVNPQLKTLCLSAMTGDGLDGWYRWIRRMAQGRPAAA